MIVHADPQKTEHTNSFFFYKKLLQILSVSTWGNWCMLHNRSLFCKLLFSYQKKPLTNVTFILKTKLSIKKT